MKKIVLFLIFSLALVQKFYAQKDSTKDVTKNSKDTFYIIGNNKPISEADLFKGPTQKQIVLDAFNAESKTRLGKFIIPADREVIPFYLRLRKKFLSSKINETQEVTNIKTNSQNKNSEGYIPIKIYRGSEKFDKVPEEANFISIGIELKEGSIIDARLELETDDAYFYFEITSPVNILHFTRKTVNRDFLEFSHYQPKKNNLFYDLSQLSKLKIRLIDVLDYHPNTGNNYIPDNVSYVFPNSAEKEKSKNRRMYKIINNSRLQHVLDLRAYTDALGLFSNEANGLFQIEGKADFFINPLNFPNSAFYYLKKVSPYIRYSRLDENENFIATNLNTTTSLYEFNENKLDLLQLSNLEMGLDINVINFRIFKESPFWTSLRFPLTYHVTPVKTIENNESVNFKTLGYGIAADIELKRFNNFGLNLGYELKGYSYLGDYNETMLSEPSYLKTQAVKAEVFYFPGDKESQSIFMRMKSVRDISTGSDSFFQLQFGYRFTIGIASVKAK